MKAIFFGTPSFAAHILTYLSSQKIEILAVVTQPDRPRGRSQKITYSPVKEVAKKHLPDVPILQPEKASSPEFMETIRQLKPDYLIVIGYGQILKKALLEAPLIAPVNVHTSLLPKYRGAAPMQRALMAGEKETGVTLIWMDEGMDTGDILAVEKISIPLEMTLGDLTEKMQDLSGPLLIKTLSKKLTRKPQNHKEASFAKKLTREEFEVFWNFPSNEIHNQVRGLSPKPGVFCMMQFMGEKKRCKILKTLPYEAKGAPGEILVEGKKLVVACKEGALEIHSLQLEGKKVLSGKEFLNGYRNKFSF